MPITWAFDPTQRFALLSVADPYTMDEWRAAMLAILEAPISREHVAMLIDRRDTEPPTPAFVIEMNRFFAEHTDTLSTARVAIVVRDDGPGMARVTQLQSRLEMPDTTVRGFHSYDEAVRWLTTRD